MDLKKSVGNADTLFCLETIKKQSQIFTTRDCLLLFTLFTSSVLILQFLSLPHPGGPGR